MMASEAGAFQPFKPETLADLDISGTLVQDLFLRTVREEGISSLVSLRDRIKLPVPMLEAAFRQLRQQQLLDVKGMTGMDYSFGLSQAGKALAAERAAVSGYVGPAPVSLAAYDRAARSQAAQVSLDRDKLHQAFADLIMPDHLLDLLGPALISQKSIFLYGPTGNGKTSLAERLLRIYEDAVWIPYAVELGGYVITLFDPVWHLAVEPQPEAMDARWVLCHRPLVAVGGELVSDMLELRADAASGVYAAPLQMKANNGILVVDDFGRQVMSPRELLNRWIVPLDRRVDYLTFHHGQKLRVPFELVVVFATNLDPSELADEAFLRRIHNKIFIGPISDETFYAILGRVSAERGLPCDSEAASYMRKLCIEHGGNLRACYPADLCDILLWRSRYQRQPVAVTRAELDTAAEVYFTRSSKT
ncbi:MAG TPA: hypothetical protein VKR61_10415 [Bryobacteraceae bacterium]|nr:hypothetical protein [Bryobacteraceae bacterium]